MQGAIHLVAPRISGTVKVVQVRDNQSVRTGDILVELDPETFEQRLAGELAALSSQKALLEELQARQEAQRTRISSAQAELEHTLARTGELEAALAGRQAELQAREIMRDQAGIDLQRAENLLNSGVIPRERYDQSKTAFDTAVAAVQSARELTRQAAVTAKAHESAIAAARAAVDSEKAALVAAGAAVKTKEQNILEGEAKVTLARLNLAYTWLDAPAPGMITRKSVETGNRVQEGQPLMTVVSLDGAYVIANFKETKVAAIRLGQRVRIRIDAYPGRDFSGTVDSIMSGTGSAFSLFPPENASGNYVKVVQRIPVKILFDNLEEAMPYLRVGMSVVPTVIVGD